MLNSGFILSIGFGDVAEAKIYQSQVQYQVNDDPICSINNYQLLDFPGGAVGKKDSVLPMQGARVWPLVGEPDPTDWG